MVSILIVESDRTSAQQLYNLLVVSGFAIHGVASSGKAAIHSARKSLPDVALIAADLTGEPDGLQTTRFFSRKLGVPAIALAPKDDENLRQQLTEAGAVAHLPKPVQRESLLSTVQTVAPAKNSGQDASSLPTADASLLDSLNVGILCLDANFKIVFANRPMAAILQQKNDALIGQDHREWVRKYFPEIFSSGFTDRLLASYQQHTFLRNFECRLQGSSDDEIWLEYSSIPVTAGQYAGGRIERFYDITERKLQEKEQRLALKMNAIGGFAKGLTHSLSNFLMAALGNLEFALKEVPDDSPVYQELRLIEKSARKTSRLVTQLRYLSSKEAHDFQEIDLNRTIGQLQKKFTDYIGDSIELRFNLASGEQPVAGDAKLLKLALLHLVANAKEALTKGGEIHIETRAVLPREDFPALRAVAETARNTASYVELSVSDNGPGISENISERMFEPFVSDKKQGGHEGLGLSIVYSIVKLHRGHISVHTESGKGTTFKLYLPLFGKEDENRRNGERHRTSAEDGETILIVEDEGAVRKVTQRILTSLGYRTLTAGDGHAAFSALKRQNGSVDLVICDMKLPEMDGVQFYRKLQTVNPNVPVLFVSGYDISSEARELQQYGVQTSRFLQKPFNKESLKRKIQEILNN